MHKILDKEKNKCIIYTKHKILCKKKGGKKLKNKVEEYRKEKGFSQEELAEKSTVSRNTISMLERQVNVNATYETMKNIADALEKKVSEIFFDD